MGDKKLRNEVYMTGPQSPKDPAAFRKCCSSSLSAIEDYMSVTRAVAVVNSGYKVNKASVKPDQALGISILLKFQASILFRSDCYSTRSLSPGAERLRLV